MKDRPKQSPYRYPKRENLHVQQTSPLAQHRQRSPRPSCRKCYARLPGLAPDCRRRQGIYRNRTPAA
ncbi:MAG: hypothetical protein ACOYYS_10135 [Chloroflexota bacterium]